MLLVETLEAIDWTLMEVWNTGDFLYSLETSFDKEGVKSGIVSNIQTQTW